jgi:hypothetical protein
MQRQGLRGDAASHPNVVSHGQLWQLLSVYFDDADLAFHHFFQRLHTRSMHGT